MNAKKWADIVEYLQFKEFPKNVRTQRDAKKNFKKKCKKFEYVVDKNKLYYLSTIKV